MVYSCPRCHPRVPKSTDGSIDQANRHLDEVNRTKVRILCTQSDIVELSKGKCNIIIRVRAFSGPIYQQLRDALLYLYKYISDEGVVKSPNVTETERF